MSTSSATFTTDTGTLYYELWEPPQAELPTITLLHNFMSSGRAAWGQIAPALAERYRLLIPDLPGHGRSQGYQPHFEHRVMASQLAALMHAVGAEGGHLVGCSSGGMLAQLLVDGQLVQPLTLMLISTTYSTNPATTGNHNALTIENFRAGRNWLEATAKLHDPHHYSGYFDEILLPGFRDLNSHYAIDLRLATLRNWTLPVCLIHGAEDEFFPAYIAEEMAQVLPNAVLHLIPEQTHALLFRQPWKVRDLLLGFLA